MKRNKKAFLFTLLVRGTIALVIFFILSAIVFKFFRLSGKAYDDFEELVKAINEIGEGEQKSIATEMDDKTAIVGFSRQEDCTETPQEFAAKKFCRNDFFPKCQDKSKSCICLAQKVLEDINSNILKPKPGSKLFCEELSTIDLANGRYGIYISKDESTVSFGWVEKPFGFVIERGLVVYGTTRLNEVHITKKTIGIKNIVIVCPENTFDIGRVQCGFITDYDRAKYLVQHFSSSGNKPTEDNLRYLISFYEKFINQYQRGDEVEQSIIEIAQIYETKLNNKEKAIEYYQKIIKDFPDSKYFSQATEAMNRLVTTQKNEKK